jgi:hypothetical protein
MLAGTVPKLRKLVNWRISRNPAQEMKGAPSIAGRPGLSQLFGYSVLSSVISEAEYPGHSNSLGVGV